MGSMGPAPADRSAARGSRGGAPRAEPPALESPLAQDDWRLLEELRERFLAARPAPAYWRSERMLELYDATFGRRIAWKWRAVLAEWLRRAPPVPPGAVVDWGCGTGIAGREFWRNAKPAAESWLHLFDRSTLAEVFAARLAHDLQPQPRVVRGPVAEDLRPAVLLVSHVLNELDGGGLEQLLSLARRSSSVIWVEPGERAASRRLGLVREALRGEFEVLAPCTHGAACGALALGQERQWCHAFAAPDEEVHRSAVWREFAHQLGIDLRALPYSYLALSRSATGARPGAVRVLGRPRIQKGRALLDACDEHGLRQVQFLERQSKAAFRALERPERHSQVWRWQERDGKVVTLLEGPGAGEAKP